MRAIIEDGILRTEPFLIVGIVAVIRRLLVISAEAPEAIGKDHFGDFMLEMGLLVAAVLAVGLVVFLLRSRPAE